MLIKVGVVWMWSQKQPLLKSLIVYLLLFIYLLLLLFIMQPVERKVLLVV